MIKIVFQEQGKRMAIYKASSGAQVLSILTPNRDVEYYKFLILNQHPANNAKVSQKLCNYLQKLVGIDYVECNYINELNTSLINEIDKLFALAKEDQTVQDFINANFDYYETTFKMRTGSPLMICAKYDECDDLPNEFKTQKMNDGQFCYYDYRLKDKDVNKLYQNVVNH